MTFTYDLAMPTDLTRVRFQIQDVDSDSPRFQDEDISFALSEGGSVGDAVRLLLLAERRRAAMTPDFKADWLTVENWREVDSIGKLLADPTTIADTTTGRAKVIYLDRYEGD